MLTVLLLLLLVLSTKKMWALLAAVSSTTVTTKIRLNETRNDCIVGVRPQTVKIRRATFKSFRPHQKKPQCLEKRSTMLTSSQHRKDDHLACRRTLTILLRTTNVPSTDSYFPCKIHCLQMFWKLLFVVLCVENNGEDFKTKDLNPRKKCVIHY